MNQDKTYIFTRQVRSWGVEAGDYYNPEYHLYDGGTEKLLAEGVIKEEPAAPMNQDTQPATCYTFGETMEAENQDTQPDKQERPWEGEFDSLFPEINIAPERTIHASPEAVKAFISKIEDKAERRAYERVIEEIPTGYEESTRYNTEILRVKQDLREKFLTSREDV